MDQRVITLYEEYVHGRLDRRGFMARAASLLGSTAAVAAALTALRSNYARAAIVAENDPAIATSRVTLPGASGPLKAYLAEPKAPGKHGGIVVVHQNRGLNPHIEDIARRLALAGYDALAVDFLSPLGGTPADEQAAIADFQRLNMDLAFADARAAAAWLRARPETNGRTGVIGFCWGGGLANQLAATDPQLDAAAVFYGVPPKPADLPHIKAALLLNFADPALDHWIGPQIPGYEAALRAAGIPFQAYIYPGANHGFNDDTAGPRYNEAAAKLAWGRAMALFKTHLG